MDISDLKNYFASNIDKLPDTFKPHPAMTANDVPLFIKTCIEEIEYDRQLPRIKEIRFEWLLALKNQMESPDPDINPDKLYVINTSRFLEECFKLPFEEYDFLRNKIKVKLLEFYETVKISDAVPRHHNISFYCKIGNHGAMQSFNVEKWISIERSGMFDLEYEKVLQMMQYQSGWVKQKKPLISERLSKDVEFHQVNFHHNTSARVQMRRL